MARNESPPELTQIPLGTGRYIKLPSNGRFRRRLTKWLVLAIIVLIPLGFARSLFTYVEPGQFGVKEVKIGMHRGIQKETYGPGFWFVMPFGAEKMYVFPSTLQVLELTASDNEYSSPSHTYDRAAHIQTSDGFYVDVDVSILYRIADPYKVMTVLGPGSQYLEYGLRPKAEAMLKQSLGELTTEDFFNSPKRTEKAETTMGFLNTDLEPKGLHVDHVLVRYFKYSDEIQKNIEEKKLQDQLVFKNEAEARAAIQKAQLTKVRQEGEMKVKIALQEGDAYRVQKQAEQDLYVRKKTAEGTLLVKTAEAEAMTLKNTAMQEAGADRKVAMGLADVLKGLDVLMIPVGGDKGVNPLDLDSLLKLFGAPVGASKVTSAPVATPAPVAEETR